MRRMVVFNKKGKTLGENETLLAHLPLMPFG